jgi:ABC-type amino acid transport substrate-binding protein
LTTTLPAAAAPTAAGGVLDAIRSRGVLRVVVLPDRMPFAFQNRQGQLVGLDVELAQALAADLSVRVEFFQADVEQMARLLTTGACDIAMSGVVITPERAADLLFSQPYLDETLAFVTRDHLRERFANWTSVRELGAARVGVPDLPTYRRVVAERAPQLQIVPIRSAEELFDATNRSRTFYRLSAVPS